MNKQTKKTEGRKELHSTHTTWHQTEPAYCGCPHTGMCQSVWACGQQSALYNPHRHACLPLGLARKTRHQTQATQLTSSPAASSTRSFSTQLSQRTRKNPAITSTPHSPYITLFPSSPKPKYFCVIGVTMVWRQHHAAALILTFLSLLHHYLM